MISAAACSAFIVRRPAWLRIQRAFMGTVLGGLAIKMAADRTRAVPAA